MRKVLVVAVVGLLASAAWAGPKKAAVRQKFIKICKNEAKKLCAGVEPGDGRIAQCLAEHKSELGKMCMVALRRAKRIATFRAKCGADVKALCPDVKPGAGRIHTCLKTNEASVSAQCKTRLARSTSKKVVADAAAVADEAVIEEAAAIEPVPESLPIEEEAPVSEPTP